MQEKPNADNPKAEGELARFFDLTRHLKVVLTLIAMLFVASVTLAADEERSDGTILRDSTPFRAAATIVDYRGLGVDGVIQIRRADKFFWSTPVTANRNTYIGVRTSVPNRTYEFTCFYKGQVCRTLITASNPRKRANFQFGADGILRVSK